MLYLIYSINGVPACANKELLTNIIRNEWGFKGYVVSDQGALGKYHDIVTEHDSRSFRVYC